MPNSPSILIIDDHPEFRELLAHHISSEWPRARIVVHEAGARPDFAELGGDIETHPPNTWFRDLTSQ